MKKTLLIGLTSLLLTYNLHAQFTLIGTSMNATSGLSVGNVGVLLNLNDGADWSGLSLLAPGTNFSTTGNITIGGTTFTRIGVTSNATSFGTVNLGMGTAAQNVVYSGGLSAGDQFGILLFPNLAAVSNPTVGMSLSLWRAPSGAGGGLPGVDGWTWPTSQPSGNIGFSTTLNSSNPFAQLTSASSSTLAFSVVPEPSTYALIALGGLALFFIVRRRKAQQA